MLFPQTTDHRSGFWFKTLLVSFVLGNALLWDVVLIPAPAIAQTTSSFNITLEPSGTESYDAFMTRAAAYAGRKVQTLFDQDLLRTEVQLTVLGQNDVAIASVLTLRVKRNEWRTYPDPEIWSVYYPESRFLLNMFDDEKPAPEEAVPTPAIAPPTAGGTPETSIAPPVNTSTSTTPPVNSSPTTTAPATTPQVVPAPPKSSFGDRKPFVVN